MFREGKKTKLIFILLAAMTLMFAFPSDSDLVFAEDSGEKNIEYNAPEDPMYGANNGIYKNENVDYSLDIVSPSQMEDKGFLDSLWDIATLDSIGDRFSEGFHYTLFSIAQFFFQLNIYMTNAMLGVLDFAYDTNLIDSLIDSLESTIVSVTGIQNFTFTSSGLFGGFLGIIGLFVAVYTLYQFLVKRASISAFSGLLKSIVVLVISLLFFSHYSTVIRGLNTLSVEASGLVLSGNAETVESESGDDETTTVKEKMNDNLFNTFVHKPYLMLQYGTTNQEEIGDSRVLSLLSKESGTEARAVVALKEVTEYGNNTLTYSSLLKRLNFVAIALCANAINSVPIYLLALSLIVFQFWFIIMAMIAPFALLWASLPNQIGVLKRYFFELSIPLVLKAGVSFLAILIFGLSEMMYNLSSLGNGSLGIFLSTMVGSLLLFTLFLLRKRIFAVFSLGSRQINVLREEMGNVFIKPMKKGVKTAVTTVGTVGGAVVGGPQGAMVGASMANSIGNAITGEAEMGDTARNVGMSMYMADRMKSNQEPNLKSNVEARENRILTNEERAMDLANNDSSYNRLRQYLQSKELPTDTINETLLEVDKLNLKDIEPNEMQKQFNNMAYLTKQGKGNQTKLFADTFAKGIKINREQQAIKRSDSRSTPVQTNNSVQNKPSGTDFKHEPYDSSFVNDYNEMNSEPEFKRYSLEEIPKNEIPVEPKQEELRLENDI